MAQQRPFPRARAQYQSYYNQADVLIHVDEDVEVALETLKHEFVDYAISKVIEPYKEVTNRLIALVNEIA